MSPQEKSALLAALANPRAYPRRVAEIRVVETHISCVFLTGERAYKVKKPIKLPFLDFSTLERRRHFCEEELRLNRRLAPELYLGVVPIGGTPDAPKVGHEPAIEYAVEMREFPADARLDQRLEAGDVQAAPLIDFAARLADFHSALPGLPNRVPPAQEAALVVQAVRDNLRDLDDAVAPTRLATELEAVRAWSEERCTALLGPIAARLAGRAHKECHGDLHLENLVLLDGRIVAFDALEFDRDLREVDVINEAAFVAMDLIAHHRADLAYLFLARYLETGGDYDGLDVLRFYLVYRAMVRAKVRAIKVAQAHAAAIEKALAPYFAAAAELIRPRRPLLVITHGLSGSGKTHLTSALIGALPALRVRSDLERKRLHGLAAAAESRSEIGAGLYSAAASEQTYARLLAIADRALTTRFDVIVDATFLRAGERHSFCELAARRDAKFAILDCAAPDAVLRDRVAKRATVGHDASEADLAVLDHQLENREPLTAAEQAAIVRVDTTQSPDLRDLRKLLTAH